MFLYEVGVGERGGFLFGDGVWVVVEEVIDCVGVGLVFSDAPYRAPEFFDDFGLFLGVEGGLVGNAFPEGN